MSKPLGLNIPDKQKPGKQSFSIRPKKVELWLDSLPKANLGETARQIYQVLRETNQLAFPCADRVRFLESLREPVQYITDAMRKHLFGVTYPLPAKNQKIAAASREIYMAMATGYKIAAQETADRNTLFQDKKQLALLIHRAINYLGQALLTSYQIYAPYTKGLWEELHKLYHYAEQRKLQRINVDDYQLMTMGRSSTEEEYLRICLLWLASPYQLRQGEIRKIYHSLERFVRHCSIHKLENPDHPKTQGMFGVDLKRDAPPSVLGQQKARNPSGDFHILNTDALAERLRQDVLESVDVVHTTLSGIDMGRPDLSHDLLRRLLIAWGKETHRTFPRTSKQEHIQVCTGLSAIHQSLVENKQDSAAGEQTVFQAQAEFRSSVVANVSDQQPDVWSMVYPTGADADLTQIVTEELSLSDEPARNAWSKPVPGKATGTPATNKAGNPPTTTLNDWLLMNESASGYCLKYTSSDSARAQVGELVGIRRRVSNRSWKWSIGVVRWMKFNPKKELQLGVEMLNPNAAAIGLRSDVALDETQGQNRTLLLPNVASLEQPATLITGPVPWRVGNKLVLNIMGKDFKIELTRMVQNTGLFAQFQFEFLENKQPEQAVEQDEWQGEDDFGQVWSSI